MNKQQVSRWGLAAFVAVGLLAGCATPEQSMTAPLRTALGGVEGVLLVPQSGLDVTVTPTDGGQGGLLGVLLAAAIDSKREESAKKQSVPMLQALHGYDFRVVLAEAIAEATARQPALKLRTPWRLETLDSDSHRRDLFDATADSAVLFVRVNYRLESGNVIVSARAQLVPKAAELKGLRPAPDDGRPLEEGNALYRKTFSFSKQNVRADTVAAALTEGANSVATQLLSDLARDR
jgi:hypothetical protein